MIRILAHAKVNLCLEVLGKRSDGYHEVATVMQAIDLADELTVEPSETLSLECNVPALSGPDNLVLRAASLLRHETGSTDGARITLNKTIPVAAGLGGGSSNAAATLIGLDQLWCLNLSTEDLTRIGTSLGSDVPFFLQSNGTAIATGRGEHIELLSDAPQGWAVLLVPDISPPENKTAALYALLDAAAFTSGTRVKRWQERLERPRSWADLLQDPGGYNAFGSVVDQAFPGIENVKKQFASIAGADAPVLVSGSGPTLFTVFDDLAEATRVNDDLDRREFKSLLTAIAKRPLTVLEE